MKRKRATKPKSAPEETNRGKAATSIAALLALFVVFMQSLSDLFALGGDPPRSGGGSGGVDGGATSG